MEVLAAMEIQCEDSRDVRGRDAGRVDDELLARGAAAELAEERDRLGEGLEGI